MDYILSQSSAEKIAAAIEIPDWLLNDTAQVAFSLFGSASQSFEHLAKPFVPYLDERINAALLQARHPFATRLPLLKFWDVIFALFFYFAFTFILLVFSKLTGKHKYKPLMLLHNLFLYVLSIYMSFGILVSARAANYTLWNNAVGESPSDWRVAKFIWLFYISKIPEWMDTFIMCLKQNYHQISFLHLYHHSTIFFIWFLCCNAAPGGEAYWSAMVNSGVHVAMYGYYFLTTVFEEGKVRRFLNNFKFVITKGQMTQFAINCVQSLYDIFVVPRDELKYSIHLIYLLFGYMITLLVLFGNFLLKAPFRKNSVNGHAKRKGQSKKTKRDKSQSHSPGKEKTKNGEQNAGVAQFGGSTYALKDVPVFESNKGNHSAKKKK